MILSPLEYPTPVFHADCNAYFTSVEQALDPSLKGKPVITGAERHIVACASYEAKGAGIQRPMRLWEAKKECPGLVALESDYETYTLFSVRFYSILRRFTPVVEEYSMDEAFGELSGLRRIFKKDYPEIVRDIRDTVENELGITISIGLSASRTLAKIASERKKPRGLTLVPANRLHIFLKDVGVKEIPGVGPNSAALLRKFGVETAHDYVSRPRAWIQKLLGKIGAELWHELRGEAVYKLKSQAGPPKASIHKCKTFFPNSNDIRKLSGEWRENLDSAMRKLRAHRLRAQSFLIHVRDEHFQSQAVEVKLARPTSSTRDAALLLQDYFLKLIQKSKSYRQTGVVLFDLSPEDARQFDLFEDAPAVQKSERLDRTLDEIFKSYGRKAVFPGTRLFLPPETRQRRLRLPFLKIAV